MAMDWIPQDLRQKYGPIRTECSKKGILCQVCQMHGKLVHMCGITSVTHTFCYLNLPKPYRNRQNLKILILEYYHENSRKKNRRKKKENRGKKKMELFFCLLKLAFRISVEHFCYIQSIDMWVT